MKISIDGINVNYYDAGAGEVLLILQGWGTNISLYSALAEHLSSGLRVILPELPGFGETPEPPEAWDADSYAEFTEKFLAALGVSRCSLLGHSNGGRIILKLAARGRIDIDKAVFLDAAGVVHEKTAKQKLSLAAYKLGKGVLSAAPVKAAFPDALEKLRSRRGSADYRAASPVMRQTLVKLVNEDFRPLMPSLDRPALLIWGENDTATPLSDAKEFERLIPDSGLVTVRGAGHYAHLDAPGFVYRVLDSFFHLLTG